MAILAFITKIPQILSALKFMMEFMERNLGPDWYKKMDQLKKADLQLQEAKTNAEQDAALIAMSRAFFNK